MTRTAAAAWLILAATTPLACASNVRYEPFYPDIVALDSASADGTGRDAVDARIDAVADAAESGPAVDVATVDDYVVDAQWADRTGVSPNSIDRMDMVTSSGRHTPLVGMPLMTSGRTYYLDNATSWPSGAGSAEYGTMRIGSVELVGTMVRYHMTSDTRLIRRTDYDGGDHSANFALDGVGEIVLEARLGSVDGAVVGLARVVIDQPASYADARFNYLSAPVGSVVPYAANFTLQGGAIFTEALFESSFQYRSVVTVDFTMHRP